MDKALTWMTNQASPWFIWIHLFDPHYPYEPPEPFLSRFKDSPYDGEVAYTDHILGRLFNHLEQSHLSDNTLIVFTADHGESLGEHLCGVTLVRRINSLILRFPNSMI